MKPMIETIFNTCLLEIGMTGTDFIDECFTVIVTKNRLPVEGLTSENFDHFWEHKFLNEFAPGCYKFHLRK